MLLWFVARPNFGRILAFWFIVEADFGQARWRGFGCGFEQIPLFARDNRLKVLQASQQASGEVLVGRRFGLEFFMQELPDLLGAEPSLTLADHLAHFAFLPVFVAKAEEPEDLEGMGAEADPPA